MSATAVRSRSLVGRVRRSARAPGQHALARAAARVRRSDRAPAPAAVLVRLAGWADLQRRVLRAVRRLVSGAAARGVRRSALARGRRRDLHVRRPAVAARDGDDVRDRRLQPVPLHHALPQQPGVSRHRPRGARGGAVRAGAVPRRADPPPPRPAGARSARPGLASVAAAVRVLGRLRSLGDEQAARSGLVRRHRVVDASGPVPRRARRAPGLGGLDPDEPGLLHRRGQARRGDGALHRLRPVVAGDALRGGLGCRDLPREHPGVGVGPGVLRARHRGPGDLGGAVDPRPSAVRRRATAFSRAPAGLARALPRRAGPGSLEVIDRDGTSLRGRPAAVLVLSRLPLTAWFALPALLLPAVRRARRA